MEADSDDLATDFGNQQVAIIPKNQQTPKQSDREEWDQSKFEKKLNMKISQNEDLQINKQSQETFQQQKNKHQIRQTVINDKNILTETFGSDENGTQKIEQEIEAIGQTAQLKLPQKQIMFLEKMDQLAIIQKAENSGIASYFQLEMSQKQYSTEPQYISTFSPTFKSPTIRLNTQLTQAQQLSFYFQNSKLILTSPITSLSSSITFRLDNIKYCVGIGVGLKEILEKHNYDYKSTTETEMGHGLYLVTSQGYSWSHSEQEDDDAFREGWNQVYSGVNVSVKLDGENLSFQWKKGKFSMVLPSRIRDKYTLFFCVYLHEKTDAISIVQQ